MRSLSRMFKSHSTSNRIHQWTVRWGFRNMPCAPRLMSLSSAILLNFFFMQWKFYYRGTMTDPIRWPVPSNFFTKTVQARLLCPLVALYDNFYQANSSHLVHTAFITFGRDCTSAARSTVNENYRELKSSCKKVVKGNTPCIFRPLKATVKSKNGYGPYNTILQPLQDISLLQKCKQTCNPSYFSNAFLLLLQAAT